MTQPTRNQTTHKPRKRIFLGPFLIGGFLFLIGGLLLYLIIFFPSDTGPPKSMALPVVAVSSQNMTQVVEIKRLPQTDSVDVFAWSPDSRVLAMGHQGVIDYWDVSEGRKTGSLSVGSAMKSIALSPDGTMLAVSRGSVTLYDVASGSEVQTFIDEYVSNIAFSPDGTRLAGGIVGGKTILWDITSGKVVRVFSVPGTVRRDIDTYPAFSPDGKVLAMGQTSVTLWDVETGALLSTFSTGGATKAFRYLSDGKTLATVNGLLDIATGKLKAEWFPAGFCSSVSPDGSVFAYDYPPLPDFSTEKAGLRIIGLQVPHPERKLGYNSSDCPMAFSPDGRLLASGSGPVSLWGVPR